jgi:hypothetical protein
MSDTYSDRKGIAIPSSDIFDKGMAEAEAKRHELSTLYPHLSSLTLEEWDAFKPIITSSKDPVESSYLLAEAKMYAERHSTTISNAIAGLDVYRQEFTGRPGVSAKDGWGAFRDHVKIGELSQEINRLARDMKSRGAGLDDPTMQVIAKLENQQSMLADTVNRGWLGEAMKIAVAPSLPMTAKIVATGLAAGAVGAAAVVAAGPTLAAAGALGAGGALALGTAGGQVALGAMAATFGSITGRIASFESSYGEQEGLVYLDMIRAGSDAKIAASGSTGITLGIAALDSVFGSVPGAVGKLGGKAVLNPVSRALSKRVFANATLATAAATVLDYGMDIVGEGVTETAQDLLQSAGTKGAVAETNRRNLTKGEKLQNLLQAEKNLDSTIRQTIVDELQALGQPIPTPKDLDNLAETFGNAMIAAAVFGAPISAIGAIRSFADIAEVKAAAIKSESELEFYAAVADKKPELMDAQEWATGLSEAFRLTKNEQAQAFAAEMERDAENETAPIEPAQGLAPKDERTGETYVEERVIEANEKERTVEYATGDKATGRFYSKVSVTEDLETGHIQIDELMQRRDAPDTRLDLLLSVATKNQGKTIDWTPKGKGGAEVRKAAIAILNPGRPENGLSLLGDQNLSKAEQTKEIRWKASLSRAYPRMTGPELELAVAQGKDLAKQLVSAGRIADEDSFFGEFFSENAFTTDFDQALAAADESVRGEFQAKKRQIHGAHIILKNSKRLIYAVKNKADSYNAFHELGHAWLSIAKETGINTDLIEGWMGETIPALKGKKLGDLSKSEWYELDETFARANQNYAATGETTRPEYASLMREVSEWMHKIVQRLKRMFSRAEAPVVYMLDQFYEGTGVGKASKVDEGIAMEPEDNPSLLENSFALAGSRQFKNQKEFKTFLQRKVKEAEKAAGHRFDLFEIQTDIEAKKKEIKKILAIKLNGKQDQDLLHPAVKSAKAFVDKELSVAQAGLARLAKERDKAKKRLVELVTADALYSLKSNANAVGWYNIKINVALSVLSTIHPEIETDPASRGAFIWALAVTSNGMKVDRNFTLAEKAYSYWKQHGKFPEGSSAIGEGNAKKAINDGLAIFNELIPIYGAEKLQKMMLTELSVKQAEMMFGLGISGEKKGTTVLGSSILGPKIGNGFYANLNKIFTQLTMDRWLMRTWGRWTGTLVTVRPEMVAAKKAELKDLIAKLRDENDKDLRAFGDIIGVPMSSSMDAIAKASQKASMLAATRAKMAELNGGDDLRRTANALWKYQDGQKEAPENGGERNVIREVFREGLEGIWDSGIQDLTMADLQALLWYPERRLYDASKSSDDFDEGYEDDEAPDYANAAVALAKASGVSENDIRKAQDDGTRRAGRGTQPAGQATVAVGGGAPGNGGGLTEQERRAALTRGATRAIRSNRPGSQESPGPYEGRSFRDARGGWSLTGSPKTSWSPAKKAKNTLETAGLPAPKLFELDPSTQADLFEASIQAARNANKFGASVYVYSPREYGEMRLFLSGSGKAGFAMKGYDIVSVFTDPSDVETKGSVHAMLQLAIQEGGRTLDCFDTVLPEIYAMHGFRFPARIKWDDNEAPPDWDKVLFSKFNNGEPDVVFGYYDANRMDEYDPDEGVEYENYSDAVEAQKRAGMEASLRNGVSFEEDSSLINKAIETYGLTEDPLESGWVFRDGRLLDMSGRHEMPEMKGLPMGMRFLSHYDAIKPFAKDNADWMKKTASMRYDARAKVIEAQGVPSYSQVDRALSKMFGDIQIELTDEEGNSLASTSIENPSPTQVLGFFRRASNEAGISFETDTTTPEFREWFGDSKVVDAEGKPLVVYHATNDDFEAFDFSLLGSATRENTNEETAANMAGIGVWTASRPVHRDAAKRKSLGLYVSIQNPKTITFDELWDMGKKKTGLEMREDWQSEGFDGLAVDDSEFGTTSYVVFSPTQIKSVYNRGTWDKDDPRISFEFIGENAALSDEERSNLERAKSMDGSNEEIRQATGWFKGKYDDRWRMEIDPVEVKSRDELGWGLREDMKAGNTTTGTLGEILEDNRLFDLYPGFKYLPVTLVADTVMGSYGDGQIRVGYSKESGEINASTINHEIQHAIQKMERFANGSSWKAFDNSTQRKELQSFKDEIFNNRAARELVLHKDDNQWVSSAMDETKYQEAGDLLHKWFGGYPSVDDLRSRYEILIKAEKESDPWTRYMNTPGEVEAYDVENRIGLDAAGRRSTMPAIAFEPRDLEDLYQDALEYDSPEKFRAFVESEMGAGILPYEDWDEDKKADLYNAIWNQARETAAHTIDEYRVAPYQADEAFKSWAYDDDNLRALLEAWGRERAKHGAVQTRFDDTAVRVVEGRRVTSRMLADARAEIASSPRPYRYAAAEFFADSEIADQVKAELSGDAPGTGQIRFGNDSVHGSIAALRAAAEAGIKDPDLRARLIEGAITEEELRAMILRTGEELKVARAEYDEASKQITTWERAFSPDELAVATKMKLERQLLKQAGIIKRMKGVSDEEKQTRVRDLEVKAAGARAEYRAMEKHLPSDSVLRRVKRQATKEAEEAADMDAAFNEAEQDLILKWKVAEAEHKGRESTKRAISRYQEYLKIRDRKEVERREKERELAAYRKERELKKALVKRIMKKAGPAIHIDYQEAIERIQAAIDPAFHGDSWIKERDRSLVFFDHHPEVMEDVGPDLIAKLRKKSLGEWTIAELQELSTEVARLRKLGRLKRGLYLEQEKRRRAAARALIKMDQAGTLEPKAPAGQAKKAGVIKSGMIASWKPADVVEMFGGGPLSELLIAKVNLAWDARERMLLTRRSRVEAVAKKNKITLGVLRTPGSLSVNDRADVGGWTGNEGWAPRNGDVMYWYIGMGNARTRQAIIAGNGIPEKIMLEAVAKLDPRFRELAEAIAADFRDRFPALKSWYRHHYNLDLPGEVSYLPMRRLETSYETRGEELVADMVLRAGKTRAVVPKGMTKSRVDIKDLYQTPIRTDLMGIWADAAAKEETAIHMDGLIRDLNSIFGDTLVQRAVEQKNGTEATAWIKKYISDLANPTAYLASQAAPKLVSGAPGALARSALAFNVLSYMKQGATSFLPFLGDAGPVHLLGSILEFSANPKKFLEFTKSHSPSVASRLLDSWWDLYKGQDKAAAMKAISEVSEIGMMPFKWIDYLEVSWGWKAVYNANVGKVGEAEAIKMADASVARTQPSNRVQDLAQIYRSGSDLTKMALMFTNALNAFWGMTTTMPKAIKDRKWKRVVGDAAAMAATGWILAAMTGAFRGDDDDEWKKHLSAMGQQYTDAIPLVGSAISELVFPETAGVRQGINLFPSFKDIGIAKRELEEGEMDKAFWAALISLARLKGLPAVQINRIIKASESGDILDAMGIKHEE